MLNTNKKPVAPTEDECCNNACDPCVWDNYYAKLKTWRKEQNRIRDHKIAPITQQK
ncbi:oxidoreductase-like domain-containing protein [Colwellia sp. E2M01]|uniref:oxidoreductase-like domain-containing protein n=1 Tax=Colwellia sp. E2M01 TaxID=2841561 RepID=UPI001C08EF11|nr:oxidoreductase-like domain-containing protein [Colwellia sp. E2M01]MBU2870719.1 oxidoreductase-like domain-containing protein [Colwellia sp. E2M01]